MSKPKPPGHDGKARRGLGRHLDGWQPAALAVLLAGSTALLAVPQAVTPIDLPEPRLDPQALARVADADAQLAAVAERGLDVDVRALGSALFAFGLAEAEGDEPDLAKARGAVIDASARARRVGVEPMLALRAHHLGSFLRELERWEATGEESEKLHEVGGGILRELARNRWLARDGERRRVLMDRAALRVLFKRRWDKVADVHDPAFAGTVDEARAFYRFLLLHPIPPPTTSPDAPPVWGASGAAFVMQYRLKKIEELGAADPAYPLEMARGVMLFQLGRYGLAVKAFQAQLDDHPDGAYALRNQNYLRAALERALEQQ